MRLTTMFVVARPDVPESPEAALAVKEILATEEETAAELERLAAAWPGCSVRCERPVAPVHV